MDEDDVRELWASRGLDYVGGWAPRRWNHE